MKYTLPLMLMALLVLAGCKKDGEKDAAKQGEKDAAKQTVTAVSHGDIETPPGFDEAIKSGQPVLVDFYADW